MAPRPRGIPSFFKIMLDCSATHLPLPTGFVRKHLENDIPENATLRSVNGGYSWRLKIKKDGDIYCFADGWKQVVEDTRLEFGDFLVFWLLGRSIFKLLIFGTNGCEKNSRLNMITFMMKKKMMILMGMPGILALRRLYRKKENKNLLW
ncbi:unnamed protein product [Lactuca saligna]|uniref:TF-B3 domain-containing protein n=1 Tax=Lactuca saligna TaxID=75948 RepID=A0AA35YQR8_LACSI|nr:unnamed protein product [Lactuca saligna]